MNIDLLLNDIENNKFNEINKLFDLKLPTTYSLDAVIKNIPVGWRVTHAYWDDQKAAFNLTKNKLYAEGRHINIVIAAIISILKAIQKENFNENKY